MPIYLCAQQAEPAAVARPVQPKQPPIGADAGKQARQRARRLLDGLFTDGAIAVSNQVIFDAMRLSPRSGR